MSPVRLINLSARQMLGLALVTFLALVVLMTATPAKSLAAAPITLSGVYDGAGNPSAVDQFGNWAGAQNTVALDYLANNSWTDVSNDEWLLEQWKPFQAAGGTLVLSVPMLVNSPTGSFAAGASGAYDKYFETLGQQLMANGDGDITLRMGWEFNGTWFPWSLSNTNPADSPAEFVAYWRHLVDLFRAIPGSHFKFDWTVNSGSSAIPATEAYPGDDYVDYVGIDLYDSSWGDNGEAITDPAARWNQQENEQYGLNWWNTFAHQHGKQLSIPEWGLNTDTGAGSNGGGDDPSYIQNMYNWMKANQPAYEMYFNSGGTTLNVAGDPKASAEYRSLWGAGSAQPAASTATPATATVPVTAPSAPAAKSIVKVTKGHVVRKANRTQAISTHGKKAITARTTGKSTTRAAARARRLARAKHLHHHAAVKHHRAHAHAGH